MDLQSCPTHFDYRGDHIKASDDQEQWRDNDERQEGVANHTEDLAVGHLARTRHKHREAGG